MSRRLPSIMMIMFFVLILSGQSAFSRVRARVTGEGARHNGMIVEEFAIYYRVNKIDIDTTYLDNPSQIRHILKYISNSPRIDSIVIYAWASPEGSYKFNKYLSVERAKAAKRFLLQHSPDSSRFNSDKIKISPLAENWPGLIELVEQKYDRPDRKRVLSILHDESIGDQTRKARLKQLDKGRTWRYLVDNYMPELRTATWISVWEKIIDPVAPITDPNLPMVMPQDSTFTRILPEKPVFRKPTVAALRTNLLVPALNFGIEIPLGNNWSVSGDYYYPWMWPDPINKDCFEILAWSLEGRYWFGRDRSQFDRLNGHSVGLYCAAGYYDFERDFAGQQGEFVSTGLDYTFALPLGKKKGVHLEFTLAVGYIHSWGRNYHVNGDYGPLFKDDGEILFDYFGPTKAAVSLVVPFRKKEGRR